MPQTARAHQPQTATSESDVAPLRPADAVGVDPSGPLALDPSLSSPAARLQAALGAQYALPEPEDDERWPLRWTVAGVLTACGAFWMAVYFVIAAMIG